jgi:hypothetical protein
MKRFGILTLTMLAACRVHVGPDAESYPPATRASGAATHISVGASTVAGELLEVRDTALVVSGDRITLVPFRVITSASFADTRTRIWSHMAPRPSEVAELRMLSRFPYGASQGVMSKLLSAKGQSSLVVVDR